MAHARNVQDIALDRITMDTAGRDWLELKAAALALTLQARSADAACRQRNLAVLANLALAALCFVMLCWIWPTMLYLLAILAGAWFGLCAFLAIAMVVAYRRRLRRR